MKELAEFLQDENMLEYCEEKLASFVSVDTFYENYFQKEKNLTELPHFLANALRKADARQFFHRLKGLRLYPKYTRLSGKERKAFEEQCLINDADFSNISFKLKKCLERASDKTPEKLSEFALVFFKCAVQNIERKRQRFAPIRVEQVLRHVLNALENVARAGPDGMTLVTSVLF